MPITNKRVGKLLLELYHAAWHVADDEDDSNPNMRELVKAVGAFESAFPEASHGHDEHWQEAFIKVVEQPKNEFVISLLNIISEYDRLCHKIEDILKRLENTYEEINDHKL